MAATMRLNPELSETSTAKIPQVFPDAVYVKLQSPAEHPHYNYQGFHPGRKTTLKKGHVRSPGYRAFPIDVIFEQDVAIEMRDGVKLHADVFRSTDTDANPVPVIVPYSPYGKSGTGPQNYDFMAPHRAGIPKDRTSGYEKFEVRLIVVNRAASPNGVDRPQIRRSGASAAMSF